MASSSSNNTATRSPMALIFSGNELIVQCTANIDDEAAAVNILRPAMENYQTFNDGKHAAIVRCIGSTRFWITSAVYAQALSKDVFTILQQTTEPAVKVPKVQEPVSTIQKVSKLHIRRPRNQFIIYRQWMSAKIHANNPGVTAGCISQIVAQMWRAETPEVKARFKALADEEDRVHKLKYPGYRYEAARPERYGEVSIHRDHVNRLA
ncbi:high mobility group box-domain-containing protein [Staphylotrichum tortipilum]|uniref:High mobility group box-domain-containing protein n=1 Tax=Staphylotrichum tortipilum TaxID=2831512 RepID=A0AAN6RWF1_9PEZI|nr:high mobility group box-domain-containing protein [Staphylotrichum longicolle]